MLIFQQVRRRMADPVREEAAEKNPILIFISNLLNAVKLPFLKKSDGDDVVVGSSSSSSTNKEESVKDNPAVAVDDEREGVVVTRVSFPQTIAPVKIKEEAEGPERSTNPVLLWQVYALGGFLVVRWAWTKWNERRGQKKPDQDDDSPNSPASA